MARFLLLLTLVALCGCVEAPQTTAPKPGTAAAIPNGPRLNCEVKNGPTGCTGANGNGMNGKAETPAPQPQAARAPKFEPYQCETGAGGMVGFWGHLGQIAEWQAYCADLERQQAGTPAPRAAGPQSTPAMSGAAGAGCVWKGRAYQPGDTIHYKRDGDIYMRDVLINGRPFYTTAGPGEGLSQPGDRAQMCECQRSVGHWACV